MCGSFNITQIQGFRISILFRCNTCIVILQVTTQSEHSSLDNQPALAYNKHRKRALLISGLLESYSFI